MLQTSLRLVCSCLLDLADKAVYDNTELLSYCAKEDCLLADKGTYQRVGEATELALRVLAEKIGLLGYAARALDTLSKTERATYCNDHWQHDYKKVS